MMSINAGIPLTKVRPIRSARTLQVKINSNHYLISGLGWGLVKSFPVGMFDNIHNLTRPGGLPSCWPIPSPDITHRPHWWTGPTEQPLPPMC